MKFRNKPIVIEAFKWLANSAIVWPGWATSDVITTNDDGTLSIHTPEGTMTVKSDTWIIRGVKGEIYPCKPDIFDATYEPVE